MSMFDKPILVFQTDFTYAEGAVSSMYGVVKSVDRELEIFDGTHQLPQYDTWSASYRLYQSLQLAQGHHLCIRGGPRRGHQAPGLCCKDRGRLLCGVPGQRQSHPFEEVHRH